MVDVFRTYDSKIDVFAFMFDDLFMAMIVSAILFKLNRASINEIVYLTVQDDIDVWEALLVY